MKQHSSRLILQSILLLFVLTIGSQIIFSQDRERVYQQNRHDHNYCESVYYIPFKRSCLKKLKTQYENFCAAFKQTGTLEEKKCELEIAELAKKYESLSPLPIKMFLTFTVLILLGLWYSSIIKLPSFTRGPFNTIFMRELESSAPTVLILKTLLVIIITFSYTQLLKSLVWPKG